MLSCSRDAVAATLFFYPEEISIAQGESVTVEVRLDTEGEPVNALEVRGTYEELVEVRGIYEEALDAVRADMRDSLIGIWIEEPSAGGGEFSFLGGIPRGYSGSGIIGTLEFRAQGPGISRIAFDRERTHVLRHDGKASPARLTFREAEITITPPGGDYIAMRSPSHPGESVWAARRDLIIEWDAVPGPPAGEAGERYSYQISHYADEVPDNIADDPVGNIKFANLDDGVYYVTLKRVGSNAVSRRKALVDVTPPEPFVVVHTPAVADTGGKPSLSFSATDAASGIDRYEPGASPYLLEPGFSGSLTVRAYDRAGNFRDTVIEISPARPRVSAGLALALFAALLIAGIALAFLRKRSLRM